MKLTEKRLKEIIKEEIAKLQEATKGMPPEAGKLRGYGGGQYYTGGVARPRRDKDYTTGRDRFAHLERPQTYEQYLEANKDSGGEYIHVSLGLLPNGVFKTREDAEASQNKMDYFDFVVEQGLPAGAAAGMRKGSFRPGILYVKDMKKLIDAVSKTGVFAAQHSPFEEAIIMPLSDWLTQVLDKAEKHQQGEE